MTNKFKVGELIKFIDISALEEDKANKVAFTENKAYKIEELGTAEGFYVRNDIGELFLVGSWELHLVEKVKKSKNQRITVLEETVAKQGEEINELKLIVAQIRKPSTVVEEALANDVIEFEGKQYKKVDRVACEGDVVIFRENTSKVSSANVPYKAINGVNEISFLGDIGNTYQIYNKILGRTRETVDVYKLMDGYNPGILMVDETPIKTANQLRAEIIEKAKGFVERNSKGIHYDVPVIDNNLKPFSTLAVHFGASDELEFVINNEKRTVVALIRTVTSKKLYHRGIAKCDPSDVFNEHIGKAIALGRALGSDVSEFEQAVQPTEKVVGMDVVYNEDEQDYDVKLVDRGVLACFTTGTAAVGSYVSNHSKVVNDTNAQYGGVE